MQGMQGFVSEEALQVQLERRRFNRVGLAIFALMLISFVASNGIAIVYMIIEEVISETPASDFPSWFSWGVTIVSLYLFAAPVCYLILRTTPAKAPERRRLNAKGFIFFLCICMFLTIVGSIVGSIINAALTLVTGGEQGGEITETMMASDIWLTVLYTGILAPILEELFFRKLLIDRLRGAGDGIVILMSGLMFGLFHGNIEQFCYAALIGALLAYIYLNTGNILYCMIFHAILNWLGGIIPLLVQMLGERVAAGVTDVSVAGVVEMLFVLVAVAPQCILAFAGLIIFIVFFAVLELRPGKLSFGRVCGAAFGNVGVILFLVFGCLEVLMTIFL